jgi:hypothetical protein
MDQNKKKIKLKSVCQIPDFPECHIQPFIMEHFWHSIRPQVIVGEVGAVFNLSLFNLERHF